MRWVLLFLGRGLREFGSAWFCIPREVWKPPIFETSPGHPEKVVPLSVLPEDEQRRWRELEKRLR